MKKYLLLIIAILLMPYAVNADSNGSITLTTKNKNIARNDTIEVKVNITSPTPIGYYEYTLDYNTKKLKLMDGNSYNVNRTVNDNTKIINKTFKFKILEEGTSKITVKSYVVTGYKGDKTINVDANPLTVSTSNNTFSDNNYLKNLEVEGFSLEPSFNKNVENYSLSVYKDTKQINVIAETDDKDATLIGDGKFEISSEEDVIELIVTSKSGEKRTYKIYVKTNKKEELVVKLEDKNYVITELNKKDYPKGYVVKKIQINNKDVNALYSVKTGYTLVALKDEDKNIKLYIYDDNTYLPYDEISFDNITFIALEQTDSFKNYIKDSIILNDIEISCYKLNSFSSYYVIYGMNTVTGNKDWYVYDKDENTLQKYNSEIDEYYDKKINDTEVLIYILAGTTLLFGVTTITLAIKYSDKRKNLKSN